MGSYLLFLGGGILAEGTLDVTALEFILSQEVLIHVLCLVVDWSADAERPDNWVTYNILLVKEAGIAKIELLDSALMLCS